MHTDWTPAQSQSSHNRFPSQHFHLPKPSHSPVQRLCKRSGRNSKLMQKSVRPLQHKILRHQENQRPADSQAEAVSEMFYSLTAALQKHPPLWDCSWNSETSSSRTSAEEGSDVQQRDWTGLSLKIVFNLRDERGNVPSLIALHAGPAISKEKHQQQSIRGRHHQDDHVRTPTARWEKSVQQLPAQRWRCWNTSTVKGTNMSNCLS